MVFTPLPPEENHTQESQHIPLSIKLAGTAAKSTPEPVNPHFQYNLPSPSPLPLLREQPSSLSV